MYDILVQHVIDRSEDQPASLLNNFSGYKYKLYSPTNGDHTIVHEKLQWLFIHRRAMVVDLTKFTVTDLSDWLVLHPPRPTDLCVTRPCIE